MNTLKSIIFFIVCTVFCVSGAFATVTPNDTVASADSMLTATATATATAQIETPPANAAEFIEYSFVDFFKRTGFAQLDFQLFIMLIIACIILYLAIVRKFEPLLLLPIAFGMLLSNLPGAGLFNASLFDGTSIDWQNFVTQGGLLDYIYLGVKFGIYPCLLFIGIGAMIDFGPMLANPKSILLGAAAQLGIFITFIAAIGFGFSGQEAASIGIIGGADGPTAIFLSSKMAPQLVGSVAIAVYLYMALVPVIQPPIMKLLTTKKERTIRMKQLRIVSKREKMIFPVFATVFIALLLPPATPLVGSLLLGNMLRESGVVERLSKSVQNEMLSIVTVLLGISVGASATAETFLTLRTFEVFVFGVLAFSFGTAGGVLFAKVMNLFSKDKINPLIGSAGVSAVPMAAKISQVVAKEADPNNSVLMHAMGPNVAGIVGTAVAAGLMLTTML